MDSDHSRREFIKLAGAATLVASAFPVSAQDEKKITLAFVGVAHIHTPAYLKLVQQRPDAHIKYIWDHDSGRAARRAKEFDALTASDLQTIWSDPEINAAVVLSETNLHRELVLAAAKAGKSVFVEKPLGITAGESREMAEAIEKAGVVFTTGYFMRTDAKNLFLKRQIADGNFGIITRVFASNCHSGSLGGWFDTEWRWMADPKIAGVGAFGDLGTHQLDILMWLLGDIDSVAAEIRAVTHRYGDCDETGQALIRFKTGIIGTLAAGWVDVKDPITLLISGTEGNAVVINGQLFYQSEKLPGSDSRKPWTDFPAAPRQPMHQFLDAVAGSKDQPLVSPGEAAARVAAMEAMYTAARGKRWVSVA